MDIREWAGRLRAGKNDAVVSHPVGAGGRIVQLQDAERRHHVGVYRSPRGQINRTLQHVGTRYSIHAEQEGASVKSGGGQGGRTRHDNCGRDRRRVVGGVQICLVRVDRGGGRICPCSRRIDGDGDGQVGASRQCAEVQRQRARNIDAGRRRRNEVEIGGDRLSQYHV